MSNARRLIGPAAIVAAGAILYSWTRRIAPDVLIDFGRELYVFWRLSEGEVLYRDIAHVKGPLSPYFNATVFRLFGASLRTLVTLNLALLTVLTALLYRLSARIAGRAAATLAGLTLVFVFAFSQLEDVGSYNFLCPYSHEVTHGITLSVAAVFLLADYQTRRRSALLLAAGFMTGLTALTDAHVFLAAAGSLATGLGLTLWAERPGRRRLLGVCAGCVGMLLLPGLVAVALLAFAMPRGEALAGAAGSLPFLFDGKVVFGRFYRWQMGTLDPWASIRSLATWSAAYVALFAPSLVLGRLVRRRGRLAAYLALALFALVAAALYGPGSRIAWESAFRPLPLVMLFLAGAWLAELRRTPRTLEARGAAIVRLVLTLFAAGLLSKTLLNVRVMDYGFALALPATLLLVLALFGWVPRRLEDRGWNPVFFRATALAAWGVVVLVHLTATGRFVASKTVQVGTGPDAFLADWRGTPVNLALDYLGRSAHPGETLAVVPEGAMLNYLARARNSTRYPSVGPLEVSIFGDEPVLESFRLHPPDRILVVHADSSIHGVRFFGRDYGVRTYSWIRSNYRSVALIGSRPLVNERFGIEVLERAVPAAPR